MTLDERAWRVGGLLAGCVAFTLLAFASSGIETSIFAALAGSLLSIAALYAKKPSPKGRGLASARHLMARAVRTLPPSIQWKRVDDDMWSFEAGSALVIIGVLMQDDAPHLLARSEMLWVPDADPRFQARLLEINADLAGVAAFSVEEGAACLRAGRVVRGLTVDAARAFIEDVVRLADEHDSALLAEFGHHLARWDAQLR